MRHETLLVFPHVEEAGWDAERTSIQRDLAKIMIASSKRVMPDVPTAMMTNERTPAIQGVDHILRKPTRGFDWIPWLCEFLSEVPANRVLYMDTDVIILRDLRPLFTVPADVVLPTRGPKEIQGRQMPFLFGVVAYKTPEFWIEIRDRVKAMPAEIDRNWWGSQVAAFEMWMEEQHGRGKWKIAAVSCDEYNYTPKDENERPTRKWALHYKGKKRKAWMLSAWKHLLHEEMAA